VQKQEAEKHPCNPLLNSLHTPRCEQVLKQEAEKHPCELSNRQASQCQEAEKHPRVIAAQLPQLSRTKEKPELIKRLVMKKN